VSEIETPRMRSTVLAQLRLLVVAGIPFGVVVAGLGSRLAMLVLRITSPDSVIGVQSDDDFTIGEVTFFGTYNLLLLGGAVGIIGVAAYQCVSPRLIGPMWFRRVTLALGAGAVVGSMLVHADGIDFTVLKPKWFAISLFVVLPALFGLLIGPVVDRVAARLTASPVRKRDWVLPILLVAAFPPTIFVLGFAFVIYTLWANIRQHTDAHRVMQGRIPTMVFRAAWLGVAVLGLLSLMGDVQDLV
jgi:hypothetical protein